MKPLLLVIWPWRFKKFDEEKIQLSLYENEFDIEVNDMCDLLSTKLALTYKEFNESKYPIYCFKSYSNWLRRLILNKKKYNSKNILVLFCLPNNGIKYLLIGILINILNCKIIRFDAPGVSFKSDKNNQFSDPNSYGSVLRNLFDFNLFDYLNRLLYYSQTYILSIISRKRLCLLTVKSRIRSIKRLYPFSRATLGSSNDYSRSIIFRKEKSSNSLINYKYCVFVDSYRPYIKGDDLILGQKNTLNLNLWVKQLNFYFDYIEKKIGVKTVIAPHPKTKGYNFSELFPSRDLIYDKTEQLISGSEFIINRQSTAISYAMIYSKPIIFILTKDLMKDSIHMKSASILWESCGQSPTRIDDIEDIRKSINSLSYNASIYKRYIDMHLSGSIDKSNPDIIKEIFYK